MFLFLWAALRWILESYSDFNEIDFDSILKLKTKEFSESFERMIVWHKRLINGPARETSKNILFWLDECVRGRDGGPVRAIYVLLKYYNTSAKGQCVALYLVPIVTDILLRSMIQCYHMVWSVVIVHPSVVDSDPKTGQLLFKLLRAYVYCQIYSVKFSSILIYMFDKILSYNCYDLLQKLLYFQILWFNWKEIISCGSCLSYYLAEHFRSPLLLFLTLSARDWDSHLCKLSVRLMLGETTKEMSTRIVSVRIDLFQFSCK